MDRPLEAGSRSFEPSDEFCQDGQSLTSFQELRMESERYSVIFFGRIFPGRDPDEVRGRIGEMFRIGGAQLDKLFSGARIVIKKELDLQTAQRYRDAFQRAGAMVELKKSEPAAAAADPAPDQTPSAEAPNGPAAGVEEEPLTLLPPRSGSLAEFAQQVEAAPIPDVSHLGMEAVGADLDPEFQPPPPLELDLSGLGLEPPGADLEPDYQPPPPLQVDTEGLSAAPANTGSLEDCAQPEVPAPLPDTSGLRLETPDDKDNGR
jgi:hypothetical protein